MAKTGRNAAKLSILTRFKAARDLFKASGTWRPQSIDDLDRWMDATLAGQNPGAMSFTSYFSGVLQISQTVASVSFPLLKREGDRRRPWIEHPVFNILNRRANPFVDAFKWRENVEQQCLNFGDSYSFMTRDTSFRPDAVFLLDTARMKTDIKDSGEPIYIYRQNNGQEVRYNQSQIFHLSAFGPTVYQGYSLIELFRAATALGLSQQQFSNSFIENGVHTSGVVTHPNTLGDKAKENLKNQFSQKFSGSRNAGRVLIFEEGMEWQTMSMPLKDAEFLSGRVFQIDEMARILNMPPHKLKNLAKATFSNIEHQQIEWVTDTIRPWFERWEMAVNTQMLTPIEQKKGFVEHDVNQLLRGDMKSTMESLRVGRFTGILNADEARAKLGMNPIEDEEIGKRYLQPSNMMDASSEAAANGGGAVGGTGETEEMVQDPGEE